MKTFFSFIVLLLLSCNLEASTLPDCGSDFPTERNLCRKEWTTLVYMAADNDLDSYAKQDLEEMQAIGSGPNLDVVVEADFAENTGIHRLHIFKNTSQTLSIVPEDRDTSEARLKNFLEWGTKQYPSKHTIVIVWGHGLGWNGGVASDRSSGESLSIPALARALKPHEFDFFVSDACLMQMAENLTELSPHARYLVGTSQLQNYLGLPYQTVLSLLSERIEPIALARELPEIMLKSLSKKEMSMSVVESFNWKNGFVPKLKKFTALLKQEMKDYPSDIRPAIAWALKKSTTYENGSIEVAQFLDLLHYELTRLSNPYSADSSFLTSLRNARSALEESTLAYAIGDLNKSWGNRSISFWMPKNQKEFDKNKKIYSQSVFDRETKWTSFLDSYFSRSGR